MFLNGVTLYKESENLSFAEFSKKIYKQEEMNYPKFFKMDNLCKLSILTVEFILNSMKNKTENTAIVLSNNASSLDTDRKHQKSIQSEDDFYPSPSVFVYTLPNIAIGEISIKHQLKSENAFFVSEKIDEQLLFNYVNILIGNNKSNDVLCGWVNFDGNSYESLLYLVSNNEGIYHTAENIRNIYEKF